MREILLLPVPYIRTCTGCRNFHGRKCIVFAHIRFLFECYGKTAIVTIVFPDDDGWSGRDYYGNPSEVRHNGEDISMFPDNYYMSYFVAPGTAILTAGRM